MSQEQTGLAWFAEHWQQVLAHPLVASALGAVGAATYAFPGATVGVKAANGVASFFIGIYLGPWIVESRSIESLRLAALIIVSSALGGLIMVNALLEHLRSTKIAQWPFFRNLLAPPATTGEGGQQP